MVDIKPFRGLRPVPEHVEEVSSLPYDVLSSEEARQRAAGHPLSFLHVIKPEIDLPAATDPHAPEVYSKGRENLEKLIGQSILKQDESPHFYLYRLQMNDRVQTGLVALASAVDYLEGRIKKHEHTRPDKEQDRVNLMNSLDAQTGPVFLMVRDTQEIGQLMTQCADAEPVYDFVSDYDIRHTFTRIDDPDLLDRIENTFRKVDALYVADGHHRSAAASRVYEMRKKDNPSHQGDEPYNYFLSVIFPDSQLHIFDYNRAVRDLNGLSTDEFLNRLKNQFDASLYQAGDDAQKACRPESLHRFGMYLEGKWYLLQAKPGTFSETDPIGQLDVTILQNNLLTPILGIGDPRTDERIHFVGGIRGLTELEQLVDSGAYQVAFSMHPTRIDQLMTVADANLVMPPKSTWFEPKLRSGLIIHMLH